jgi:hypothetical protein
MRIKGDIESLMDAELDVYHTQRSLRMMAWRYRK